MDLSTNVTLDQIVDVHICGACRTEFNNVDVFVHHKKQECPVLLAARRSAVQEPLPVSQSQSAPTMAQIIRPPPDLIMAPTGGQFVGPVTSQSNQALSYPARCVPPLHVVQQPQGHEYVQSGAHNPQAQFMTSTCTGPVVVQLDPTQGYMMPSGGTVHQLEPAQMDQGVARSQTMNNQPVVFTPEYIMANPPTLHQAVYQSGTVQQQVPPSQPSMPTLTSMQTGQPSLERAADESARISKLVKDTVAQAGDMIQAMADSDKAKVKSNKKPVKAVKKSNFTSANTGQTDTPPAESSTGLQSNTTTPGVSSSATPSRGGKTKKNFDNVSSEFLRQSSVHVDLNSDEMILVTPDGERFTGEPNSDSRKTTSIVNLAEPLDGQQKGKLEKRFLCTYNKCPYRTAYLKDLERHYRVHTGERPFKCQQCDKAFNRQDKLALHTRYHNGDKPFQCDQCDYSAVESGSLRKHMQTHTNIRPFKCQVCPYSSRSASQLQIHLRVHTGDNPFSCPFCKSKFKVNSDLKRHLRIHTGEKPYACDQCNYKCSVKGNLSIHKRINHSENQIQCEMENCTFSSSSKKMLREHMKSHEVKEELICQICNYQCSTKSALKNHQNMHVDLRPFKCEFCTYASKQSGNIQTHMRRKHPEKLWMQLKRRQDRKFNAKVKYKEEIELEAEKVKEKKENKIKGKCEKAYKCHMCDSSFVREDALSSHLRHHRDLLNSPLSTAYAVLKLQQPVFNTPVPASMAAVSNAVNEVPLDDGTPSKDSENTSGGEKNNNGDIIMLNSSSEGNENGQGMGKTAEDEGPSLSQTLNLGIKDILAAAGMSTLSTSNTAEGSPEKSTSNAVPSEKSPAGNKNGVNINISVSGSNPASGGGQVVEGGSDGGAVQVMPNMSLQCVRLPSGQVMMIPTQAPQVGQFVSQQMDNLTSVSNSLTPLQSTVLQSLAGQELIPAGISTTASTSGQALPTQVLQSQQQNLPIQIILPNDSQQALPIMSRILDNMVNRMVDGSGAAQAAIQVMQQPVGTTSAGDGAPQPNILLQVPGSSGQTLTVGTVTAAQATSGEVAVPVQLVPTTVTSQLEAPENAGQEVQDTGVAPQKVTEGPGEVPQKVADGPVETPQMVTDGPGEAPQNVNNGQGEMPQQVADSPDKVSAQPATSHTEPATNHTGSTVEMGQKS